MMKESLIIVLGIITLVTPFLGIPGSWKTYIFVGIGTLIILAGIFVRRSAQICAIRHPSGERRTEAYVESEAPLRRAD